MNTTTQIKQHLLAESRIARFNDVESMGIALAMDELDSTLYHYGYVLKRISDMEQLKKSSAVTKRILIEQLIASGKVKTDKEAEAYIASHMAKL